VRFSAQCAALAAGMLSVCLATTAMAQAVPAARPAAAVAPPAAAATAGTSVAVLDVAYVFKNFVRFNGAMNDIKKEIEAFQAFLRQEQAKMQTKAEGLKAFTPSSDQYKKAEEELVRTQTNLQIDMNKKQKEFLEKEAKAYFDYYKEMEQVVIVFAQRNRLGLVLRYSGEEMKSDDRNSVLQGVNRPVIYQQNLDITEYILAELNRGATMPSPGVAPPAPGVTAPTNHFSQPQPPARTAQPGLPGTPQPGVPGATGGIRR
jgi:Skp family chaperone for outer membrane proteins